MKKGYHRRSYHSFVLPLSMIFILVSWMVGFALIPLRHAGIVHMATWINIAFFWGPYVVFMFAMIIWLAVELWRDAKVHNQQV